ncbi:MAG: hypothetical protein AAGF74_06100 [Pseudomonadota bacterium]
MFLRILVMLCLLIGSGFVLLKDTPFGQRAVAAGYDLIGGTEGAAYAAAELDSTYNQIRSDVTLAAAQTVDRPLRTIGDLKARIRAWRGETSMAEMTDAWSRAMVGGENGLGGPNGLMGPDAAYGSSAQASLYSPSSFGLGRDDPGMKTVPATPQPDPEDVTLAEEWFRSLMAGGEEEETVEAAPVQTQPIGPRDFTRRAGGNGGPRRIAVPTYDGSE